MAKITTTKERRDFIADEVRMRIIGPGFAHEAYLCQPDSCDEILSERPNRVYMAGFLSPALKTAEDKDTQLLSEQEEQGIVLEGNFGITADDMLGSLLVPSSSFDGSPDEEDSLSDREDAPDDNSPDPDEEKDEDKDRERADFAPSHMGLITCISNDCSSVDVQVKYGVYHLIRDVEKEVKVPWGRCSKEQLEETFKEYDEYAKTILFCIGKQAMSDIISIDYENKTVSPKGIFYYTDEIGSSNKYLRASQFPDLVYNRVARTVCALLVNPAKEFELGYPQISAGSFYKELSQLEKNELLQSLLTANSLNDLVSHIAYDAQTRTAKINISSFDLSSIEGDTYLLPKLIKENPVKEYLLPRLLKTHFFKREDLCEKGSIDLTKGSLGKIDDFSENIQIRWKTFTSSKSPNKKYLRVLAINKNTKGSVSEVDDDTAASSGRVVTPPNKWLYQFRLKVSSHKLMTYTEPHSSTIDEEFQLNEKLYVKEKMYGKGVNCALTWEFADSEEEMDTCPSWVETTCCPKQKVRSFSSQIKENGDNISRILDVYDLSYFSAESDASIINGLRNLACEYNTWHVAQKNSVGADSVLTKIIAEQKDFLDRLNENIDYLQHNARAMRCFRIANAAMYIQMLLTKDIHFRNKYRSLDSYTNGFNYGANVKDVLLYFKQKESGFAPQYRPFQLAFLVMNVKSTFENTDIYRNNNVDLIWFPTGGGKTEAYLALTALTIAERRTSQEQDVSGVSVIMRYTLRMLTSQQFQRASYLITAMEFLRAADLSTELGADMPITLGMWIGGSVTPNSVSDLNKNPYKEYFVSVRSNVDPENNPFPISSCPWCGCKMSHLNPTTQRVLYGYDNNSGNTNCINPLCHFHKRLPIYFVDEPLYKNPPTLLFATVDKFAQIATSGADNLFGIGSNRRKLDLIIQDELHLISGPLGSMVGMFETLVEELCTQRIGGNVLRKPKIVASTATTRNTAHLVKELYNRDVRTFPVSGVSYDDNFFSYAQPLKDSKRLYIGMAPTAHTAAELEIHTIAAELVAKEILIRELLSQKGIDLLNTRDVLSELEDATSEIKNEYDNYWTIVSYYINKQSLGKTCSRIGQEIRENVNNMRDFIESYPSLEPLLSNFENRTTELTARQDSARIKQLLVDAENRTSLNRTSSSYRITSNMDLVLATNMISVGIDIARWNIINMIGQPLTTAEYIQSSSRVGRTHDGLVVSLYNPLRTRELSYYENYIAYHQIFYKYVEPLSVTAFTEMTLQKLLCNVYASFMLLIKRRTKIGEILSFDVEELKEFISKRSDAINHISHAAFQPNMNDLIDSIHHKYFDTTINPALRDVYIRTYLFGNRGITYPKDAEFPRMGSLRDVESNTYILYE